MIKFTWKLKKCEIPKATLSYKNKARHNTTPGFKSYYREVAVIKPKARTEVDLQINITQ